MRVALITEPVWLQQEVTTLQRLAVALVDQQVQLVPIVPEGFDTDEADLSMTSSPVRYEPTAWSWLRDFRIGRLASALGPMEIDIVHALDAKLERVGQKLATELAVPLVCGVWSAAGADGLRGAQGEVAVLYVAPTRALADRCSQALGGAAAEVVRPGVFVGADASLRPPLDRSDHPPSILVIGDGQLDAAYQALLEGMASLKQRAGAAMYFFYAVGSQQHKLWRAAEALGLQGHVSWVPVGAASRDLLVQADVVVLPQASGVVRSIVLEAMRAARPVIAVADTMLDYLIDGTTARILHEPSGADWARALLAAESDRPTLIELGASAHAYVARHHSVTQYAEAMFELYCRASPPTIPFAP